MVGAPGWFGNEEIRKRAHVVTEVTDWAADAYGQFMQAFTLTERPVADVVAEAGFGPVPPRIEITADFCQCPACRAERCEP